MSSFAKGSSLKPPLPSFPEKETKQKTKKAIAKL